MHYLISLFSPLEVLNEERLTLALYNIYIMFTVAKLGCFLISCKKTMSISSFLPFKKFR